MEEVWYYWYSEKQYEAIEDMRSGDRDFRNYVSIDGREKEYTECRERINVPCGKWNDYKHLGVTAGFRGYTRKI